MRKTATKINDLSLPDLQAKITELGTALFFPQTNAVLRFPVHVITIDRIDEAGFIAFQIPHPGQSLREFDQEFPVKLDFYKKGAAFFIQIDGKASIAALPGAGSSEGKVGLRVEMASVRFSPSSDKSASIPKAPRKMRFFQSALPARPLAGLRPVPVLIKK